MPRKTIDLTDEEIKILVKRGKKNILSVKEQIEDIVRRSCVNYKTTTRTRPIKVDDKLVAVFSRQKSGRKKKKE